jgi:nucleoside-diphosphate-sugar epimerase
MSMNKLITIVGADGAQGSPVVESAPSAGYRVRVVGRHLASLQERFGSRAEMIQADLSDPESLHYHRARH